MVLKQDHGAVGVRVLCVVGAEGNRDGWERQREGRRVVGVQDLRSGGGGGGGRCWGHVG